MSSSDDAPRIGTWVPQLFFDLIARVVPGAITIGALLIASYGPTRSLGYLDRWLRDPPESSPAILIILLTLTTAYALSIVLWGIWYLAICTIRIVRLKIEPETGVEDTRFSLQYDFIKQADPQAGNRITKQKAEIHLAVVLMVGFSLSLLVDGIRELADPGETSWALAALLGLGILGSASSWRFFLSRTRTAVETQCDLLGFGKWYASAHTADANTAKQGEVPVEPCAGAGLPSGRA